MTKRHEIERAIAAGDLKLAQSICDEMRGAQGHNWQVRLNRLTRADDGLALARKVVADVECYCDSELPGRGTCAHCDAVALIAKAEGST